MAYAESYYVAEKPGHRVRVTVTAGSTSQWFFVSASGGKVVCKPGSGGTMSAQLTSSPSGTVQSDNDNATSNASAETWPAGTVSAVTSETFERATAVRFTATTADGIGEIAS